FQDQLKMAGGGTGFLITPDVLVTAGHVIPDDEACAKAAIVFDYSLPHPDVDLSTADNDQVYYCQEVIVAALDDSDKYAPRDYALIRLDRKADFRQPLLLNDSDGFLDSVELTVVGHPQGLPLKVAAKGRVRENGWPNYFISTVDAFSGNSGSPVFNSETGKVEGILVSGDADMTYDEDKNWEDAVWRPKVCREEEESFDREAWD